MCTSVTALLTNLCNIRGVGKVLHTLLRVIRNEPINSHFTYH